MKVFCKSLAYIALLALVVSCKKPIGKKNTAFYGVWEHFSEDGKTKEQFVLVNDSLSTYSVCTINSILPNCCQQPICFDCAVEVSGEALVNNRYLFITDDRKFKIDKEPYVNELLWEMVIDGKVFRGRYVENCEDGKQNRNEERVDCGGCDCDPCPTCTDGLKNQGEQEIDCGGGACNSCYTKAQFELSLLNQNNYVLKTAKYVKAVNKGDSLRINIATNDVSDNILSLNFLPFEQLNGESFFAANTTMGKYKVSSGKIKLSDYKKTAKTVSGTFDITLEYSYWTGGSEGNGNFITEFAFIKNGVFEGVKY